MGNGEQQYSELSFYTLSHPDPSFIHQHIVDAHTAQTADGKTKAVSIVFSLVGLYLYVERKFTGRQVQAFHTLMSKNKRQWPEIALPAERGDLRVSDVLAAAPGTHRDAMIRRWCESVWEAYRGARSAVVTLVEQYEGNQGQL